MKPTLKRTSLALVICATQLIQPAFAADGTNKTYEVIYQGPDGKTKLGTVTQETSNATGGREYIVGGESQNVPSNKLLAKTVAEMQVGTSKYIRGQEIVVNTSPGNIARSTIGTIRAIGEEGKIVIVEGKSADGDSIFFTFPDEVSDLGLKSFGIALSSQQALAAEKNPQSRLKSGDALLNPEFTETTDSGQRVVTHEPHATTPDDPRFHSIVRSTLSDGSVLVYRDLLGAGISDRADLITGILKSTLDQQAGKFTQPKDKDLAAKGFKILSGEAAYKNFLGELQKQCEKTKSDCDSLLESLKGLFGAEIVFNSKENPRHYYLYAPSEPRMSYVSLNDLEKFHVEKGACELLALNEGSPAFAVKQGQKGTIGVRERTDRRNKDEIARVDRVWASLGSNPTRELQCLITSNIGQNPHIGPLTNFTVNVAPAAPAKTPSSTPGKPIRIPKGAKSGS